jgi:xanthosine utilization system XapX-like protein
MWLKFRKWKDLLSPPLWKDEWKEELSVALKETQKGLKANFIAVIIRESDLYGELLFLLSFAGLSVGLVVAYFLETEVARPLDLLLFPILGFCVGTSIFHFKKYFLKRIAAKAVRQRVAQKAKSLFYDHQNNHKGPVFFLFFSELEKEAVYLASRDVWNELPHEKLRERLQKFSRSYEARAPLKGFKPLLEDLGSLLKLSLNAIPINEMIPENSEAPVYFISSGTKEDPFPVAVLKGNKDIN